MSKTSGWQTLDVASLLQRREEATTSAGVGAYPVPLGQPLRRQFPATVSGERSELRRAADADPEYARALRMMGWLDD